MTTSSSTDHLAGVAWRTSSRCGTGACVQVAAVNGMVAVRDSKNPHGPVLTYTPQEWADFIAGAKNGEFDDIV